MEMLAVWGFADADDLAFEAFAIDEAFVADLAAHLSIEWGLTEDDFAFFI